MAILYVITDDNGGGIGPYISNPVMDGVASPGSSDLYARGDHVHPSDTSKADKSDLASISVTGTTNTTGSTIPAGTYFYLNGALVSAKTAINNGDTFTSGTNYSSVTAGSLNELKSALMNSVTTLLASSTANSLTKVTLNDSIDNYSFVILSRTNATGNGLVNGTIIPVAFFKTFNSSNNIIEIFDGSVATQAYYSDSTHVYLRVSTNSLIAKLYGVQV